MSNWRKTHESLAKEFPVEMVQGWAERAERFADNLTFIPKKQGITQITLATNYGLHSRIFWDVSHRTWNAEFRQQTKNAGVLQEVHDWAISQMRDATVILRLNELAKAERHRIEAEKRQQGLGNGQRRNAGNTGSIL